MTETAFELHLKTLDRCQDKRQRDDYLAALERAEGASYAKAVNDAWFELRTTPQPNTPHTS